MAVKYPFYDFSYTIAYLFTWGSIVWVLNAVFVFYPFVSPAQDFPNETTTAAGVTAFVGATIFEVGSVLLIIEAVNENRTGCFGWAMEQVFEEHGDEKTRGARYHFKPDNKNCEHHHANKSNLVGKSNSTNTQVGSASDSPALEAQGITKPEDKSSDRRNWVWFASWHELKTHYLHELGFLACLSQLLGATIFWISGFTALPGILNVLSPGLSDGIYWTPQVVGGSGFIVSGFLFMVETQSKWYIPAPKVLGWHIGLWNLVGGLGFTLSPCFGYDTATWAQYQAALSTFWGSWAFLIGSTIQWYESLDKHPVEVDKI